MRVTFWALYAGLDFIFLTVIMPGYNKSVAGCSQLSFYYEWGLSCAWSFSLALNLEQETMRPGREKNG